MTKSLYPETCAQNSKVKDSFHAGFLDFKCVEKIENLAFFQLKGKKMESKFFGGNRNIQRLIFLIFLLVGSVNSIVLVGDLAKVADANTAAFPEGDQTAFNLFQIENWYQQSLVRDFFASLNSG